MKSIKSKTVVFIHGSFVHYTGWDNWKHYFESKGYKTIALPWPKKEASPETLRSQHPNSPIATLRLKQVINFYEAIVEGLPEKPIIIGHSMGGLITQVLVNRGLAAAGICIHPVPPQGIIPYEFSFFKAGSAALGLFTSTKKDYLMSFKKWQYAFTNGMSLADQKESYEKSVVPESKLMTRDSLSSDAYVDFKKPHPPLLFIAGTTDHIMPGSITHRVYNKYARFKDSVTELKEFPDTNHYAFASNQFWKVYADNVLHWIDAH